MADRTDETVVIRARKRPVEISALHWKGGKCQVLADFCGLNWGRADVHEVDWCWPDDKEQVVVWNMKERQWLCLPVGHWLIRGIDGELYPCDPDVFARTYERI